MSDNSNKELVLKHLQGFADIDNYLLTLGETVTEDLEWANSGFPTHHGLEQAHEALHRLNEKLRGIRIECLSIAEDGNQVLTERIDYMVDKEGNTLLTLPCMGIFTIENGRIKSWRDYFDGSAFK
ncbi:TPA: nuclear transport factor 2 family protein [Pseudomonas aeruginosa]|nr:nuclear transport factor 2 family protein [Pseudomonas aeruginosa]